jgi:hypothetical protein
MAIAPAAARAATYSVAAGGGACGGADLACGTLADAATAAATGDVFQVAPGEYASATFAPAGVTVVGTGPGVNVRGALVFNGGAGPQSVLQRVTVVRTTGPGAAITGNGANGLAVRDVLAISTAGPGVLFTESGANTLQRSSVFTTVPSAHAVRLNSISSGAKALTIDSTIVAGGAAGVGVVTGDGSLGSQAGNATLTARHLTAASSAEGIVLDASGAKGLVSGVGSIAASVTDSIVLNGRRWAFYTGLPVTGAGANTAAFTAVTRTREAGSPESLFVNPSLFNFHLRATSPAIDAAGFTAGESTTDVDGDARPGPVTDQGADEFVNHAPVARLTASPSTVRAGGTVSFSAAGSVDPDNGPITGYAWSFGDGGTATTTTPTVTHRYTREGRHTAVVVVVDSFRAVSAPSAPVTVNVTDGTPPLVRIDRPRANQALRLTRRVRTTVRRRGVRRRVTVTRRNRISFAGRASDASGMRRVTLSLRLVARARRRASSSQAARCTFLDPRRGFVRRRCSSPLEITARLRRSSWTYTVPSRRRLPAGSYRLTATGTDRAGITGNVFPVRTVSFRLR